MAVADWLIVAVEPEIEGAAGTEIDTAGLHVFPGLIDPHLHSNEPDRTGREVDLEREQVLEAEDLLYRHRQSPYVGRVLRGRVVRTLIRGNEAFGRGKAVSGPVGRLVRPAD